MVSIQNLPLELILEVTSHLYRLDICHLSLCSRYLQWTLEQAVWGRSNEFRNDLLDKGLRAWDWGVIRAAVDRGATICSIESSVWDCSQLRYMLDQGIQICGSGKDDPWNDRSLSILEPLDLQTFKRHIESLCYDFEEDRFSERWTRSFMNRTRYSHDGQNVLLRCLEFGRHNLKKLIAAHGCLVDIIRNTPDPPVEVVDRMLRNGSDPNRISTWYGMPPLRAAMQIKSDEICKLLLQAGADITEKAYHRSTSNYEANPCLFLAIDYIVETGRMDYLHLYVDSGGDLNVHITNIHYSEFPWDLARESGVASMTCVVYYLLMCAKVGWNTVHRPVDVLSYLYRHGADLNPYRDGQGCWEGLKCKSKTWLLNNLRQKSISLSSKTVLEFIAVMEFLVEYEPTYSALCGQLKLAAHEQVTETW